MPEWQDGHQPAKQRDAERPCKAERASAIEDECGKEDNRQQGAVGTQQRGIAPGKCEGQHPTQVRALEHGGKGTEAKRNAKDGRRFGEGHGHVVGREGTKRRQPERCHRGSVPADAANEVRDQQACRQIDHHLQVENGEIILLSKNRKAQGEEARVSG